MMLTNGDGDFWVPGTQKSPSPDGTQVDKKRELTNKALFLKTFLIKKLV